MDLEENIPTIEDSDESPVKMNKQEFSQPKPEEKPYVESKARYPDDPPQSK